MIKWRFFISLLKERDWLEEMATKGWLLTDMDFGVRYHFKKIEPCEKVYEVERFAISGQPDVKEISARKQAMDVVNQTGWELVTWDEEMTHYFVKDKEGDETDEFYDEEFRRERAERYRKRFTYEGPVNLLKDVLVLSILYGVLFFCGRDNAEAVMNFMWIYFIYVFVTLAVVCFGMHTGNLMGKELSLSREEWIKLKNARALSQKKSFKKVKHLVAFLQEQNEQGLVLTGYNDGKYLFEKDNGKYNYYVDTRTSLKKRMKKQGHKLTNERKDWYGRGLKWFEISMQNAEKHQLKPVALIGRNVLIYRRPVTDEATPWENGEESMVFQGLSGFSRGFIIFMIVFFFVGLLLGLNLGEMLY